MDLASAIPPALVPPVRRSRKRPKTTSTQTPALPPPPPPEKPEEPPPPLPEGIVLVGPGAEADGPTVLPKEADGFRKRVRKGQEPIPSASVPGMTVGQVRRALMQIRRAGSAIRPEHLLFNGMTAGRFALMVLQGHKPSTGRRKKSGLESVPEGGVDDENVEISQHEGPAPQHADQEMQTVEEIQTHETIESTTL